MADNSLRVIQSLDDLKSIRVTSLNNFRECPQRWRATILGQGTEIISQALKTGTALHNTIEKYLLRQFELYTKEWEQELLLLEHTGVPAKERSALLQCLQSVTSYRDRIRAIEHEFKLYFAKGNELPPLVGHIDLLLDSLDGSICIVDWKSDRQPRGVKYWKTHCQLMWYAEAVRCMWPELPHIHCEINYILLNDVVRWTYSKEELSSNSQYLSRLYYEFLEEFRVYSRTGEFPERVNKHCKYCQVKKDCRTLQQDHLEWMNSFYQRRQQYEASTLAKK